MSEQGSSDPPKDGEKEKSGCVKRSSKPVKEGERPTTKSSSSSSGAVRQGKSGKSPLHGTQKSQKTFADGRRKGARKTRTKLPRYRLPSFVSSMENIPEETDSELAIANRTRSHTSASRSRSHTSASSSTGRSKPSTP